MRAYSIIIAGIIILAWLFFPNLFQWWALNVWSIPADQLDEMGKLGPFGDIYGSLNTLISSIALCAVAFSTWLQVTSLKENKIANEIQVKLTKEAHDEQMRESRNAIFANKFYGLLNYKNDKLNQIKILYKPHDNLIEISGFKAFEQLARIFVNTLRENPNFYKNKSVNLVKEHYKEILANNFNNNINALISYLYLYADLINLIKESDIDEKDKNFYRNIVRNSMFQAEQLVYFWIGIFYDKLYNSLDGSDLFNQFYADYFFSFAAEFHKESHFYDEWAKRLFNTDNNKNPT